MGTLSKSNWNLEVLVFEERGKPEYPEKNLSELRTRTNNKLNPHMTPSPGIEPGPHWWEASALTTAPSLLCHPWSRIASYPAIIISREVIIAGALLFVDVSEEDINTMKENAVPKGTEDVAKSYFSKA